MALPRKQSRLSDFNREVFKNEARYFFVNKCLRNLKLSFFFQWITLVPTIILSFHALPYLILDKILIHQIIIILLCNLFLGEEILIAESANTGFHLGDTMEQLYTQYIQPGYATVFW